MAYFSRTQRAMRRSALPLMLIGFVGGISSPAFGDPVEARSASPVSSSASSDQNAQLLDATQNLVQALVKSVQQASVASQPAAPAGLSSKPLLEHKPAQRSAAEIEAEAGINANVGIKANIGINANVGIAGNAVSQSLPSMPWTIPRGAQLQTVLTDWCHRAGWTLVWQSEYSYRVEAPASFDGDFVSAVTAMFGAMKNVSPTIYPDIYKGNRVVVVKNDPTR
jgi:hypothetical protein